MYTEFIADSIYNTISFDSLYCRKLLCLIKSMESSFDFLYTKAKSDILKETFSFKYGNSFECSKFSG